MNERTIAILTSGKSRGSNFTAICQRFREKNLPVKIGFLTVSNLHAPVVEKCKELGVKYIFLPTRDMAHFEKELLGYLEDFNIRLIALAGFLKKLSADFIKRCRIPILNIHPALLPKYGGKGMYGEKVHQAVFAAGEKESGVTVHLVNEEYDSGDIILQKIICIEDCRSPQEIAARVLELEHKVYAEAIWKVLNDSTLKSKNVPD